VKKAFETFCLLAVVIAYALAQAREDFRERRRRRALGDRYEGPLEE